MSRPVSAKAIQVTAVTHVFSFRASAGRIKCVNTTAFHIEHRRYRDDASQQPVLHDRGDPAGVVRKHLIEISHDQMHWGREALLVKESLQQIDRAIAIAIGNFDDITIIDAKTRKAIISIPVGRIPWGVAIDD